MYVGGATRPAEWGVERAGGRMEVEGVQAIGGEEGGVRPVKINDQKLISKNGQFPFNSVSALHHRISSKWG